MFDVIDIVLIGFLMIAVVYILQLEKQRRVILGSYAPLVLASRGKKNTTEVAADFLDNLEAILSTRDYSTMIKLLGKLTNSPIKKDEHSLVAVSNEQVARTLGAMIDNDIKRIERIKRDYPNSNS
jgi:hypothetical protein